MAKSSEKNKKQTIRITCTSCGRSLASSNFYETESILYKHYKRIPVCKRCIYELYDRYLNDNSDKRVAIYLTCRKIDVQFSNDTYDIALKEHYKTGKHLFGTYMMKHSSLCKKNAGYINTTFDDSESLELINVDVIKEENKNINEELVEYKYELTEEDEKIKSECITLMGRDPFYGYALCDQKFLYGDLLPYLDEDTIEDGYKLSKIIQLIINFWLYFNIKLSIELYEKLNKFKTI